MNGWRFIGGYCLKVCQEWQEQFIQIRLEKEIYWKIDFEIFIVYIVVY